MSRYCRTVFVLLFLLTPLVCLAQAPLQPRTPADRFVRPSLPPDTPVESIVLKFHEGTNVRLRGRALTALPRNERQETRLKELHLTGDRVQSDLHLVHALLASSREVRGVRRLFTADEPAIAQQRARGEARSGRELADLDLYFLVEVQPGLEQGDVESLVAALNAFDSVEIATVETPAQPAGDISPVTPSFETEQGYLDSAALGGIDARYSWTIPGGKGAGMKMIDVEVGWRPAHEDLPALFHQGGAPYTGTQSLEHGTAVLGEVVAPANGYGVTGIAHQAQAGTQRVSSIQLYPSSAAINDAALLLDAGDVILIELHTQGNLTSNSPCPCPPFNGTCDFVPVEFSPAVWDAIAAATANGIIVVEPAGNGATDLDDPAYNGWFAPSHDSGAILVGAGNSGTDRSPTCFTTYGSRVDVHAWGWDVVTLGYGDRFDGNLDPNQYYTAVFDGTSSATPIVAGAVLNLQGVAGANGFPAFTPSGMRQWLKDTGTPQASSPKHIGPQPNLRAAIDALINDPPVARFTFACTGFTCSFDSSGSTDDHGIVSRSWSFGGSGVTANHTFPSTGEYTVTLTVTDAQGLTSSQSKRIVINEAPLAAQRYFTVAPCRVLDTRTSTILSHNQPVTAAIAGSCGIPSTATAVSFNVTAISPTGTGKITLYPGNLTTSWIGAKSSLNFAPASSPRSNSAVVRLATNGAGTLGINADVSGSPGQVHLLLDVQGYFSTDTTPAPGAQGPLGYQTLSPCRMADTRPSSPIVAGTVRTFSAQGVCGVPAGAAVASLHVGVAAPANSGSIALYPSNIATPGVSSIDFPSGVSQIRNGARVTLAPSAPDFAAVYSGPAATSVHAYFDVHGYYKSDAPLKYHPIAPCRSVSSATLATGTVTNFQIQGNCGIPVGAKAALVRLVVGATTSAGDLTVFPSNLPLSSVAVSTMKFDANEPGLSMGTTVPLSTLSDDLAVAVGQMTAGGTVVVSIDVFGYFQ